MRAVKRTTASSGGKTYVSTTIYVTSRKDRKREQRAAYHNEFRRARSHHMNEPMTIADCSGVGIELSTLPPVPEFPETDGQKRRRANYI